GELLCDYYHQRFNVDVRGVRYPGLISYVAPPGGGTTDYAVEIFYEAIQKGTYSCFLPEQAALPMMYMPDALQAAVNLMEADPGKLVHRNAFNIAAFSFTPAELYTEIKKLLPDFTMSYDVDPVKEAIAASWPQTLDDSAAREEWGWKPDYSLAAMVKDMIAKLSSKLAR
ncbi:MAG TPA: L-threonine 3-dehydrogenase, partial [bacterium]|nr:L-threonine 3-dehydrogenase [bacterium]